MTNSSAKKIKGPIRTEAVVPFVIFCIGVGLYFSLFFDTHLRWGLEAGIGSANGAEANISSVKTSFLNASLEIKNIQITDAENPKYNILQIGSIKFKALWDGLLRGKIVIDESSITDIQIKTVRKNLGKVYPKPKEKPEAGPSKADEITKRAGEKFEGNILGDVATTLEGKSGQDQVQVIADQLKANIKAKELEKELKEKESDWKKKFESLPKPKEVEQLVQHLKEIKFNTKNPQELISSVQDAQNTIKEIDTKINSYKTTGGELQNDFNKYSSAIKDLEKLVQEDIRDLENRLKIPRLDAKSISNLLFGNEISSKIKMIEGYKTKYQQYLPPMKSKEEKKAERVVVHERSKGKTYQFGRPKSYPLFWLKLAKISSKSSNDGFSGDVEGKLTNVSSDPKHLGIPIKLDVKGDFPKQQVLGLLANITADFSGEAPVETFTASVSSFPVDSKKFSDTEDLKFGFKTAVGSSDFVGKLVGTDITMSVKNKFQKIDYLIEAKNKLVEEVLTGVSKDIPLVTLNADVTGSLTSPGVGINSNLGEAIGAGFKKQIDIKIKELQDKVKKTIEDAVAKEKEKLTKQFDDVKAKYLGDIEAKKGELEKQKQVGQNKINEAQKSAENQAKKELEKKGQEVLDDLKKKFKF